MSLLVFVSCDLNLEELGSQKESTGKIGEGVIGFLPQMNSFLLLGPRTSMQNFIKIN